MKVPVNQIRLDGGTQPRCELVIEVIEDYAEKMRSGVEFPAIIVFFDGHNYWLADGYHRVAAAKQVSSECSIEAEVRQGTQSDAQWYSFSVNKTHGLRRTTDDRIRALRAALKHPNSVSRADREIAEHVGVDHKTVAKYLSQKDFRPVGDVPDPTRRTGRDGKSYVAKKPRSDGRRETPTRTKAKKRTSLHIHKPTRTLGIMEKMTSVTLPHNPVMGAMTLIEVFDADYLRNLVAEISNHLKGLEA